MTKEEIERHFKKFSKNVGEYKDPDSFARRFKKCSALKITEEVYSAGTNSKNEIQKQHYA